MKVPTFQKYGITKAEFETVEKKQRWITHFLTHQIPLIIGLAAGLLFYLLLSRKFHPAGAIQYIQQVFILITFILVSIGISMLIFQGLNFLYNKIILNKSLSYIKAAKYESERDEYDFWKLRFDENFWKFMDGLSVEKEILNLYLLLGYTVKSEISTRPERLDYILKDQNDHSVYVRCFSTRAIDDITQLKDIVEQTWKIRTDEIHVISIKGYNSKLLKYINDPKVRLYSPKEISRRVRKHIEKSN